MKPLRRQPCLALPAVLCLATFSTLTLRAQTGNPTSSQNLGVRPVGTSTAVPGSPTTLFAYGPTATDIAVQPKTDDGSISTTWTGTGPEGSSLTMAFLSNSYGGLFVNTNGNLSFGSGNTSFENTPLTSRTGPPLLAPFFADVDLRGGTASLPSGNIWYRTTQNAAELASITARLGALAPQNFNPIFAQIVTWDKVGHYNQDNTKVSTFQAVIATDGSRTYTLFLYPENAIWWDNGTLPEYAGTFARIGYSTGDGVTGYEISQSGTVNARDLSITSNTGQPGTFVFDVGGTLAPVVVNGTLSLPAAQGTAANVLQLSANAVGHTITSTTAAGSILFNQLTFADPANTVAFTNQVVALANATNAITAGNITFANNAVLVARATGALNGGTLTLKDSAKLAIYAEGASTTATALTFNKTSDTGGTLDLRGFNTAIGAVTSTGTAAGVITNSGATASTLTFGGTDTGNFNGVLQNGTGFLNLAKTGPGTQILSGTNTYTGTTTVSGGTLQFAKTSAFYNGTIDATTAAKLTAQTGGTASFNVGGTGEFSTAHLVTLADNANFTGGALGLDTTNSSGGTFTFNNSSGPNISFAKLGTGSLVFSGSPYTGATLLHGGDLAFTYSPTLTSLAGTGGILTLGAGQTALIDQTATTRFAGGIAGSGQLIKTGPGRLTLAGTNTHTGTTTINAGTLQFAQASAFYNGTMDSTTAAKLTVASGATAAFNVGGTGEFTASDLTALLGGNFASGSILALDTTNAPGGLFIYNGNLSGALGLSKIGLGALTLGTANTFGGGVTVSGGTLQLGHSFALQNSTLNYNNQGGTLNFGSLTAVTLGGLAGAQSLALANNSAAAVALTIGGNHASTTFSGILSGPGLLVKIGTGTLTLGGPNTYPGITTVSGGTLQFATPSAFYNGIIDSTNAGKLTIASGATAAFNVGGTGEFSAANIDTLKSRFTTGAILGLDTTNADAGTYTYTGILGGTLGLTKLGSGTLMLVTAHTYTGPTTISAGTLALGSPERLSDSTALTVSAGASFNLNGQAEIVGSLAGAGTVTNSQAGLSALLVGGDQSSTVFSGTLSGNVFFAKTGSGTLTLSGTNTHTGGTTISEGTVEIGAGGTTGSIIGNITNEGDLLFNRSDALTYAGVVSGSGYLIKDGAGTLTLTGASTYTGTTIVFAGTLQIGSGGTTGSLTGNILNNAALSFNRSAALTYAGVISGSGSFTKTGAGTLTLTGTNTYTGATTVSEGTLQIGAGGTTGSLANSALSIAAGATVRFDRSNASTFAGSISGTGTLIKTGAGNVTFTGSAPNFQGTLLVNEGLLTLASAGNALGDSSSVTISSGASLSISGGDENFGSIAGAGTLLLATRALGVNHTGTVEFSGTITDSGAVNKGGSGNWILSGNNTYTGTTTLNLGTLTAGSATAFGTGTVRVNAGTLNLANHAVGNALDIRGGTITGLANYAGTQTVSSATTYVGTVGGAVSVTAGGTLQGTATFTGAVTLNSGGTARGTGNLQGGLVVNSGGTVSPGNSPGTLAAGNTVWLGGGNYVWEVNDADGSAGADPGWDLLAITGTLDMTGASSSNQFNLLVTSLTLANLGGDAVDFGVGSPGHIWTIVSTTGGVIGFDPQAINLNLAAFTNLHLGAPFWSVRTSNSGLDLQLVYVPEPSTWAGISGLAVLGAALLRRRRSEARKM